MKKNPANIHQGEEVRDKTEKWDERKKRITMKSDKNILLFYNT